jgi:hypothetical protein
MISEAVDLLLCYPVCHRCVPWKRAAHPEYTEDHTTLLNPWFVFAAPKRLFDAMHRKIASPVSFFDYFHPLSFPHFE